MDGEGFCHPVAVRIALGCLCMALLTVCARGAETTRPKLDPGDVVYFQSFDESPLGPYTADNMKKDWRTITDFSPQDLGPRLEIVEGKEAYQGRSLRLLCPKGTMGGPTPGGAYWLQSLGKGNEEMYLSYMVRFPKDFDFVQGGKLPGIAGGVLIKAGQGPSSTGWLARIYWNSGRDSAMSQYVYSLNQRGAYGDHFFWEADHKPVSFARDVWHHVESRVVMNTPDQSDGILQAWANGKLVVDKHDMRWRNTKEIAVDNFVFSVFFGGSGEKYMTSKDEYIYFDHFLLSRKYAGPPAGAGEPAKSGTGAETK